MGKKVIAVIIGMNVSFNVSVGSIDDVNLNQLVAGPFFVRFVVR